MGATYGHVQEHMGAIYEQARGHIRAIYGQVLVRIVGSVLADMGDTHLRCVHGQGRHGHEQGEAHHQPRQCQDHQQLRRGRAGAGAVGNGDDT